MHGPHNKKAYMHRVQYSIVNAQKNNILQAISKTTFFLTLVFGKLFKAKWGKSDFFLQAKRCQKAKEQKGKTIIQRTNQNE